ncbi:MAG: CCA tRNA nucleotidyltransferase, partial [Chloroflexi bacterium]|nr:CCA tRNA nucleotidyltransferase [Chloroflexota bacterium]
MTSHRAALQAWLEAMPFRREAVAHLMAAQEAVYLVGGSVRDALLGRHGYDLDVVIEGSAIALGRRLADALRGAFFVMDREHDVARVVVRQGEAYYHVDLAGLRAKEIEGDLRARDFTINAMAVPLRAGLGELLDPTGGLDDLRRKVLRAAYEGAFRDD